MPRRFLRKFTLKRDQLDEQWFLSPFGHLLHDPRLWSIRRRTVVPAFALGLFVAYLPFPGHMVIGALLALALRVNIPIAVLSTWASNPLTIGPMYYVAYTVGATLLDRPKGPFEFELSVDWLVGGFGQVWQPLLLGCLLLGAMLALLGYVVLDLVWRASIWDYVARRQRRKSRK